MILLVSFAGEVLKLALPFPVPGSIYGMLLLFIALCTGVIRLEHVRETGLFLVEIMPILFVSAGVGLMDSWGDLRKILLPVLLIMLVTWSYPDMQRNLLCITKQRKSSLKTDHIYSYRKEVIKSS